MAYNWGNSKLHLSGYFALLFLAISGAVFQGVLVGLVCLVYSVFGCFFIILIDNIAKYLKIMRSNTQCYIGEEERKGNVS
jgi:hypothetical protein